MRRPFALSLILFTCLTGFQQKAWAARRYIYACEVINLPQNQFQEAYQLVFIRPGQNLDFSKPPSHHFEIVSSLMLFGSNYPFAAFEGQQIFEESAIDLERKKMEDKYFGFIEGDRADELRSKFRMIEDKIPGELKLFLGVYDPKDEHLLGMLRMIRVPVVRQQYLGLNLLLKELGIKFDVKEIFSNFPDIEDKTIVLQAGMAYGENSPAGTDAKNIWEIFLGGANGMGHKSHIMLALADASRSIRHIRRYGFKVQYRLFFNLTLKKWQLERADEVKRDAPKEEMSEYILAIDSKVLRSNIMNRVITDSSFWSLFERDPEMRNFFEMKFTNGQGIAHLKSDPKFNQYFTKFPKGLGR